MWDEIAAKFQKYVETGAYNGDQLTEIMEGLKDGVEIIVYADPRYDAGQMHEIRLGLGNGISTKVFTDRKFNAGQMHEIRLCIEEGLEDIEINAIANPKYSAPQMAEIRDCYKERISLNEIRLIANEKFSAEQMATLREVCKKSLVPQTTLKRLANPEYAPAKMKLFVQFMQYNHDLTLYCDPSYTEEELKFYFNCLDFGLEGDDFKALLSKALSQPRRVMVYEAYEVMSDKFAFIGANPEYSDEQVEDIYFYLREKSKILYDFKNIWSNDNEEKLLELLKYNKKGTTAKLYSANKSMNLELTDAEPIKWNLSKNKAWKGKVFKIFKELEKSYLKK